MDPSQAPEIGTAETPSREAFGPNGERLIGGEPGREEIAFDGVVSSWRFFRNQAAARILAGLAPAAAYEGEADEITADRAVQLADALVAQLRRHA